VGFLEFAGEGAAVVAVEEVLRELGELAGAEERPRVDHVRRKDFGIAVLAGVEVEHEVGEGAFEASARSVMQYESRSGDLCGTAEVEDTELFAELPVRLGRE